MPHAPLRWMMTGKGEPLVPAEFNPFVAKADEVVVEIAGCGVCHTDLGYYYDGVRTNHALPLTLGHEISGRVVDTGSDAFYWADKTVIVPAVIPCGTCDVCRRGKPTICPNQKMPGNDIHGGFATHIVVPAHGLCAVDEVRLQHSGIDLADLSVIADAVTTPYQAVIQAGVQKGDLVVVNGVGGVGGYAAQIAHALGGTVVAVDVSQDKLDAIAGNGAALTLNAREMDPRDLKQAIKDFAKKRGLRQTEWIIFECSGTPRRPGDRVRPDQSRRDAVRGRLHHGQGRGSPVEPDGVPRPRDRQLGLPARALPGRRSISCSTATSRSPRSSRNIRSATSTRCSRRRMSAR